MLVFTLVIFPDKSGLARRYLGASETVIKHTSSSAGLGDHPRTRDPVRMVELPTVANHRRDFTQVGGIPRKIRSIDCGTTATSAVHLMILLTFEILKDLLF